MNFVFSEAWAQDKPIGKPESSGISQLQIKDSEMVTAQVSPENFIAQNLVFLVLLFAVFYFVLIRPQQNRLKAHQKMVAALQKGTKILTSGGILGTIVKLESDEIALVEIAQNVRVRIARATIQEILPDTVMTGPTANDN